MRRPKVSPFLAGAAGALLVLAAAAVIVPQYSNYGMLARAYEVLRSIQPVQDRVSSQVLARQSVSGSGRGISYSDGAVSWRCIGGSAKDVPRRCRD